MRIHNSVTDTQDHFVFKHIFFPSLTFEDLWTVFCHCGFSSYFSSAEERDSGQLYDRKTRCRPSNFWIQHRSACLWVLPFPLHPEASALCCLSGLTITQVADNNRSIPFSSSQQVVQRPVGVGQESEGWERWRNTSSLPALTVAGRKYASHGVASEFKSSLANRRAFWTKMVPLCCWCGKYSEESIHQFFT